MKIMDDDIFDILGISIFASDSESSTLKDIPCTPLSSFDEYIEDGKCSYESDKNDD